jgi:hypothetical protein
VRDRRPSVQNDSASSGVGTIRGMGELGRDVVAAAGVIVMALGFVGAIRVILGRPAPRPAVAALETLTWLVVVMAAGGLLFLAASRL